MPTKDILRWLAEPPRRNFTLGEAFQRFSKKRDADSVLGGNHLGFTRLGRGVERLLTGNGMIMGGLLLTTPGGLGRAFLISAFCVTTFKASGILLGKITDIVYKNALDIGKNGAQEP